MNVTAGLVKEFVHAMADHYVQEGMHCDRKCEELCERHAALHIFWVVDGPQLCDCVNGVHMAPRAIYIRRDVVQMRGGHMGQADEECETREG